MITKKNDRSLEIAYYQTSVRDDRIDDLSRWTVDGLLSPQFPQLTRSFISEANSKPSSSSRH
jgi:hypothetical protein